MNIVITAGGTSEYIDSVRKITNMATGELGVLTAVEILNSIENAHILFLGSKESISILMRKRHIIDIANVDIIEISDTNSLKYSVKKILEEHEIHSFVHSMAVSDYTVDKIFSVEEIIKSIKENNLTKEEIINLIKNPICIDNSSKISSNIETMDIRLKKTPKIINMIKEISPDTQLIGFKLLNNVSHEELISVARKSIEKTSADYIIANDLSEMVNDHIAYIVDPFSEEKVIGKGNIAKEISNLIKERNYD